MTDIMCEKDLYHPSAQPTALEQAVTTMVEAIALCEQMLGATLIEEDAS